jgi:hypothetical protein
MIGAFWMQSYDFYLYCPNCLSSFVPKNYKIHLALMGFICTFAAESNVIWHG